MDRNGFPTGQGPSQGQTQGHGHDPLVSQSPQSPQNQLPLPTFTNSFSLDFLVNTSGAQYQTAHSHSPLSPGIPAGSPSYSPSSAAGHSPVVSTPYNGPQYQVQANPSDGFPSLFAPFAIPNSNNNVHGIQNLANLGNIPNAHNMQNVHGLQNNQGIGANAASGVGQWQLPVAHGQVQTQGHQPHGQAQQVPYSANNPIYYSQPQPQPHPNQQHQSSNPTPQQFSQLSSLSQHPQPQPIGPFSNVQNSQSVFTNFNNADITIPIQANTINGHNVPASQDEQSNCSQTPPELVPTSMDHFDPFNGLGFESGMPVRVEDHRRSLDSLHNQDIYDARDRVATQSLPNSQSHQQPPQHSDSLPIPLSLSLSPESMRRVDEWRHNSEKQQVVINILTGWELTLVEQASSGATGSNYTDPKLPSNDDLLQLTRPHHNNASAAANAAGAANVDGDEDGEYVGTSSTTKTKRSNSNGNGNGNSNGNGKKTGKGSRGKPIGYICIWPNCEDARTNKSLRSDRASEHVRAHLGMIPYRCHKGSMDFLRKADRDRHSKACKGGCAPRTSSHQIHVQTHSQLHSPPPVRSHSQMQTRTVNRNMGMSPPSMQNGNMQNSNFVYRQFASTSNHSLNSVHSATSSSQSPIVSPVTVQSQQNLQNFQNIQSHQPLQYPAQHRKQKHPRNLRGLRAVSVDGSGSEEISSGYGSAPASANVSNSTSAPAGVTSFYPGQGRGSGSASANTSPTVRRRPLIHHKATLSGLSTLSASSGNGNGNGNGEYEYDYTHNSGHTQSQAQPQNAYTTGHPFNPTLNTFTNATTTFDSPITISPHRNSLPNFSPFSGSLQLSMPQEPNQPQSNVPYGSESHSYSHPRH